MHFERDILLGKKFTKKKLKAEAKDELNETSKGRALEKAIENKKAGKPFKHIKGHNNKQLI